MELIVFTVIKAYFHCIVSRSRADCTGASSHDYLSVLQLLMGKVHVHVQCMRPIAHGPLLFPTVF